MFQDYYGNELREGDTVKLLYCDDTGYIIDEISGFGGYDRAVILPVGRFGVRHASVSGDTLIKL